jgi:2-polyprenyl-6-methoxyphenol hydroxylase-like FAD-dependent oxidoreductase
MWLIPIPGNRFAWSIGGRILDADAGKEDVRSFSFAEWFPELATDVCDLVRDYVLPDLSNSYQEDGHYKDIKTDADFHHHDTDAATLSGSSIHSTMSTGDSSNASSRGNKEFRSESLMHSATIHLPDNIPGLLPRRQTPTAKPGTVGELIDSTPNDRVSKVMLESKLFKTWHHERTVLIGDACHKVLPFAG